jgi:hypothetical protein
MKRGTDERTQPLGNGGRRLDAATGANLRELGHGW